jgi:hypothetical protein
VTSSKGFNNTNTSVSRVSGVALAMSEEVLVDRKGNMQ